jgi:hypothetical protein
MSPQRSFCHHHRRAITPASGKFQRLTSRIEVN